VLLLLNRGGNNIGQAEARLRPLVDRVIHLDDLNYDRRRVELIKHVNKVRLWSLVEYGKLVFIDLDMVLRGSLEHLFQYPGEPTSFLSNPENPTHFNSGLTIVEPDNFTFTRIADTLAVYTGGWDYTDQALSDAALRSVFGQLPITTCPKKRLVYTHAQHWQHASATCMHWTGENRGCFRSGPICRRSCPSGTRTCATTCLTTACPRPISSQCNSASRRKRRCDELHVMTRRPRGDLRIPSVIIDVQVKHRLKLNHHRSSPRS